MLDRDRGISVQSIGQRGVFLFKVLDRDRGISVQSIGQRQGYFCSKCWTETGVFLFKVLDRDRGISVQSIGQAFLKAIYLVCSLLGFTEKVLRIFLVIKMLVFYANFL